MIEQTRDRTVLAELLGRDPVRYAYELGDLSERYFGDTRWWLARRDGRPVSALLLYQAFDIGVVLAHGDAPETTALWAAALPELPDRLRTHYRAVDAETIAGRYEIDALGTHLRMHRCEVVPHEDSRPRPLVRADLDAARALYAAAMPVAHFDERTLDDGLACGIDGEGGLLAIASCHVFSPDHGVAALGAIATHPDARGQGCATAVTAALMATIEARTPTIVLNVTASNAAAIAVYRKLGFRVSHEYEEAWMTAR